MHFTIESLISIIVGGRLFPKIYSHKPLINRLLLVDFLVLFLYPLKSKDFRHELMTNKGGANDKS